MNRVVYEKQIGRSSLCGNFEVRLNDAGQMVSVKNRADAYQMEWLNGKETWGTILAPDELTTRVSRCFTEDGCLRETYSFQNTSLFDVFVKRDEIGIYTTFPDDYQSAKTCMKQRCHVHVWCGCNTSYLYGLRMGAEAPHLGLVLTEGSVDGYSIVRDENKSSNDRGCLILHPEAFHLAPMETLELSWELFWFDDRKDFFRKMLRYENVLLVSARRYVTFPGELQKLKLTYGGSTGAGQKDLLPVRITRNGISETVFPEADDEYLAFGVEAMPEEYGEQCWEIQYGPYHTTAKTLALPEFQLLVKKRCEFIVDRQQYLEPSSPLFGAFLVYDNEEKRQYYSHLSDHNGGRERVGMGILLARYLQNTSDPAVEHSLQLFRSYLYRELFDRETGMVYNDICRNNDQPRLYNYPWAAEFFMEIFRLYWNPEDLESMYRALMAFYRNGGQRMYAIEIPVVDSLELLYENKEYKKREELLACYRRHADFMLETGLNYPAHEVNYEQSIVAPGVDFLLQVYQVTREEKYLEMAGTQMRILELFNGTQPDWHMYETAIRHWDGYWFGKRRMYGDTFPHYWSALTGNVFLRYAEITGDTAWKKRGEDSLRGVLGLYKIKKPQVKAGKGCIGSDGEANAFDVEASCAFVYPRTVNGKPACFMDPWANDQDWGMYFYLRGADYIYLDGKSARII